MCQKNTLGNINGYPLDEQQLKAAMCEERYSIIIAGAGSGKSTTMIGKIKYLIQYKNIKPEEILCISFTNEATNNLKNNISKNCGIEIAVKTFHKLALNILENNYVNYKLAPNNYLEYVVNEFLLTESNFFVINNSINFLKNKFYVKTWHDYLKITKTNEFQIFKNTIIRFLNLYFANFNSNEQLKLFFINTKKEKNLSFLKLLLAIYSLYQTEKSSQHLIDFDDMINIATNIVINNGVIPNYKYIIIDEFQDTSQVRFELIKAIINRNKAHLTVVGDDFQSIYRFSGCNLNIFLNFNKEFEHSKVLRIENTYRNSQELIDVAGSFIMKNPNQIKKNLKSNKHIHKPIKIIYERKNSLKVLLLSFKTSNYKNILILGRNNFDINKYIDSNFKIDKDGFITVTDISNITIRFLTVHKSKGLEADIVLLINLVNDKYGFPNKIEDHKIFTLLNNSDFYPLEEERRLFYVGLTRTKNNVYLLTEKNNPSIFVKELLKYYKKYVEIIKKI